MLQKLKSLLLDDTVYMAFLLILVAIASFGLGRMSVGLPAAQPATVAQSFVSLPKNTQLPPVATSTINGPVQNEAAEVSDTSLQKNFVASKSGTKFHALNCPGAKQIKDSNKIFFQSEQEAEAAGYTRAANCKF